MCYEYIYCGCCYSYDCCCLVFGALSCGKRSKSHLGAKDNRNIRAYPTHGDRMWVWVRVPPKHLKTYRSYRCIVCTVGSLWWSRCVCCPRCSIVSRVDCQLQLQVELELELEIPLIMLRRSQVINLISHNALPGSMKGSIDDPSREREQEVAKERGRPRVAIECLSLCSQPDVWIATLKEIAKGE